MTISRVALRSDDSVSMLSPHVDSERLLLSHRAVEGDGIGPLFRNQHSGNR